MTSAEIHPTRWRTGRNGTPITLIVIHTSEGLYDSNGDALGNFSAENLKRWMGTDTSSSGNVASYHAVADTDSVADCVSPQDRAFGAGGVNFRALHLCVTGKSASIPWDDWLTSPGGKAAVVLVAQWCRTYAIPATFLAPSAVKIGEADTSVRGICGHNEVSAVYPQSNGHTDPGNRFPWIVFIGAVRALLDPPKPPTKPDPIPPLEAAVRFWKLLDCPGFIGLAVIFAEVMPGRFIHVGATDAARYAGGADKANAWANAQEPYPGGWAAFSPNFFPRA